jgi:hypothetical protein
MNMPINAIRRNPPSIGIYPDYSGKTPDFWQNYLIICRFNPI